MFCICLVVKFFLFCIWRAFLCLSYNFLFLFWELSVFVFNFLHLFYKFYIPSSLGLHRPVFFFKNLPCNDLYLSCYVHYLCCNVLYIACNPLSQVKKMAE